MAVASKSAASARKSQAPLKTKAVARHAPGVIPLSSKAKGLHSRPVPILPSSKPAPLWLLRLCSLQRSSFIVTLLLIAGMLQLYSWTINSQKTWDQTYRKLENLRRNERQLTTTNEMLKNHLALQAEQPATALTPSDSSSTVFLPASQPPANKPMTAQTLTTKTKLTPMPLGY